jgi:indolepyruvate ferredoxin oxidoreductase
MRACRAAPQEAADETGPFMERAMHSEARGALKGVALDDKYDAVSGLVYMTGTQALVRLPMLQRERDLRAGLNTAGYITGYRGSPLGAYDQALTKAKKQLDRHHLKFVPGLNEDLAATALWGTQQVDLFPGAQYDGVFGIWYGKGPGVDRSGDVFRHANQMGSAKYGGVVALAGDDHAAKSSTMAAQTDYLFQAVSMPVLAPAALQDYLDFGLHGFAMSRFAGVWVALKATTDTIETAGIVDVSVDRVTPIVPTDFTMPAGGLNTRWPEQPFLKIEERLARYKIPAVLAYARANRLDRNVFGRPDGEPARLGIVATGKAYLDLRQALDDLGIEDATACRLGVKVYKVAMPWPLEPAGITTFCAGCSQVLVVEEKRSLIQGQLKDALYASLERPSVIGKHDEHGQALLPDYGELSPAMLARVVASLLKRWSTMPDDARGVADAMANARIDTRIAALDASEHGPKKVFESIERIPYFCSGCPHNTSTRVPEGSRALAGIGCHYMAQWMDRSTDTFTHMGGEGMAWVGQAPFTDTKHVFQNLGDGTYFHSGSLAIRHAVATKTSITYKILFNDAVAMTGGQTHDGALTPAAIAKQVQAEGVKTVVVVTDDPDKYPAGYFDSAVEVFHRSKLDDVQRTLREIDDVSVLIYDQTCAAEKRRRRKRGSMADPQKRVFINEAVCEGCGDCGVQSNCVSIEPVETEFGRKREINQSSCNKDYSCVEGFCPSFVTIEGGALRRGRTGALADDASNFEVTEPTLPTIDGSYALLITGVGGTGVVTIGQLLGMAAHLDGKAATVLDMAGLAQKNGAVMSFAKFAASSDRLHAPRIGIASADAVIGGDVVVTASKDALARYVRGHTRVVCNIATIPTADFTSNADWKFPLGGMEAAIADASGDAMFVDATRLATHLLGDAIASNLFLLGYAYQHGIVPVSAAAIARAIELNNVAVESNLRAFLWGRRAAADPVRVAELAAPTKAATRISPTSQKLSQSLDELIARRVDFLADYQDQAYAQRYLAFVDEVRTHERGLASADIHKLPLTAAVARYLFKLMAYKDEYEVARLYTSGDFIKRIDDRFEGDFKIRLHLAPPLFAKRNTKGELVKREYGPWMLHALRLLAGLKGLRGTRFDPFGYSAERREERRLIDQYRAIVRRLLIDLAPEKLAAAVQIASIPEGIRGYGHVKARHLTDARALQAELLQRFDDPSPPIEVRREQPIPVAT